jgi:hypothetical protein
MTSLSSNLEDTDDETSVSGHEFITDLAMVDSRASVDLSIDLNINESNHAERATIEVTPPTLDSIVVEASTSSVFTRLSAEHLAIIYAQSEEFQELLRLLAEQKRGLKNDLAQQAGISRTRVMIEIQKFNRQLEAAQLSILVVSKFETTRTAPVSGSYLHWLG